MLRAEHQLDEAEACYRRAIELKPDYAKAHDNLGLVLADQYKFVEAAGCYRRALAVEGDSAEALNNLGVALAGQDRPEEAIEYYRRALALCPDYANAHYNYGMSLLATDKWAKGWQESEMALEVPGNEAPPVLTRPAWDGTPLAGAHGATAIRAGPGRHATIRCATPG